MPRRRSRSRSPKRRSHRAGLKTVAATKRFPFAQPMSEKGSRSPSVQADVNRLVGQVFTQGELERIRQMVGNISFVAGDAETLVENFGEDGAYGAMNNTTGQRAQGGDDSLLHKVQKFIAAAHLLDLLGALLAKLSDRVQRLASTNLINRTDPAVLGKIVNGLRGFVLYQNVAGDQANREKVYLKRLPKNLVDNIAARPAGLNGVIDVPALFPAQGPNAGPVWAPVGSRYNTDPAQWRVAPVRPQDLPDASVLGNGQVADEGNVSRLLMHISDKLIRTEFFSAAQRNGVFMPLEVDSLMAGAELADPRSRKNYGRRFGLNFARGGTIPPNQVYRGITPAGAPFREGGFPNPIQPYILEHVIAFNNMRNGILAEIAHWDQTLGDASLGDGYQPGAGMVSALNQFDGAGASLGHKGSCGPNSRKLWWTEDPQGPNAARARAVPEEIELDGDIVHNPAAKHYSCQPIKKGPYTTGTAGARVTGSSEHRASAAQHKVGRRSTRRRSRSRSPKRRSRSRSPKRGHKGKSVTANSLTKHMTKQQLAGFAAKILNKSK